MSKIGPLSTESNLIGYIEAKVTTSASSITVRFYDKITGDARTPLSTTRMFVIDKGTSDFPNDNYEIVICASHSTASGVTTLATVSRGLAFSGASLTAGTGKEHSSQAEIGPVDVHYLLDQGYRVFVGTHATGGNNLRVGDETAADISWYFQNDHTTPPRVYWDDSEKRLKAHRGDDEGAAGDWELSGAMILTTAERDALTNVLNGMAIYNSTLGQTQWREGGAWVTNAAGGTVADASTTVAGKIEIATAAERAASTATGGTGAVLVPSNDALVKTSSGAGDENKVPILGSDGKLATGFIPSISPVDLQTFTADGTWTKPSVGTMALVVCVGAGGGGGGGRGGAAGSERVGGTGGGGGAKVERWFRLSDLGATEAVVVGVGGPAGTGGSSAVGVNGSAGGETNFGTTAYIKAFGGGGGFGGPAALGEVSGGGGGGTGGAGGVGVDGGDSVGGLPGSGVLTSAFGGAGCAGDASDDIGNAAEWGGGAGGRLDGSSPAQAAKRGRSSMYGGAGGGAGATIPNTNTEAEGGLGGAVGTYVTATTSGGGGAVNGGAGAAGAAGDSEKCGTGGAGGGSQDSGTGGVGGAGGAVGGGGGGGGGGTTTGGAGGAGGRGQVWVYTF